MSKGKRRNKIDDKWWFPVPMKLPESDVWRLLSHAEQSVYIEMRCEWSRQTHGSYDGLFVAPYGTLNASPETISRALSQYQRFGLLEIHTDPDERGGLYGRPTLYRMSKKWEQYKPTPDEQEELVQKGALSEKRRNADRARRIQRLRQWERQRDRENESQLRRSKRAASPTEAEPERTARELPSLASPVEAGKLRKT